VGFTILPLLLISSLEHELNLLVENICTLMELEMNKIELNKVGRSRKCIVRNKGALAIECQTYTRLVSPAKGPKKKMEVLTTQAQDHCRASY